MSRHLMRFGISVTAVALLQIAGLGAWQAVVAAAAIVMLATVVASHWSED